MSGQLKEVRGRIASVKSTQQITKAMKMVSAAKLRKATNAITEMRPYANRLNKMLVNILSNLDGDASTSFGQERPIESACLVIVTSDRGLCGGFNTNIIKEAIKVIEGKYAEVYKAGKLSILPVGKKGSDALKRRYEKANIISDYINLNNNLDWEHISEVPNLLMDKFKDGTYDDITVCYSKFKNAAVQDPFAMQYLPVAKLEAKDEKGDVKVAKSDYIFEPDKITLLENLVPSILQTTFQKYLYDNRAGEHGARMSAMDKATENAEDLMNDLKIFYNKARQEAITKELSEIVGGAAALGG